jgi:hypothetical protein
VLDLALLSVLSDLGLVLGNGLLLGLSATLLERSEVTLALESDGGDETLDLGGLGVGLSSFGGNFTSDH